MTNPTTPPIPTTITGLPAATTPLGGAELVPIVQGGITKNVTAAQLVLPGQINQVIGGADITTTQVGGVVTIGVTPGTLVPLINNTTLSIPSQYSDLQAAANAAVAQDPNPGASSTLQVTGHQNLPSGTTIFNNFGSLKIRGSAPVALTFSSVNAVSGSAGNYSVAYNVSSAAGVSVGDVVTLSGFTNSFPTQGGQSGYAPQGSFQFGISSTALSQVVVSCTASSTTITFNTSIAVSLAGYVIGIGGQFRKISTHTAGTNTATVSSAFLQTFSSYIYWQLFNPEAGTVAVSTTAVTGTSTSFSTRVDPGDIFIVMDSGQFAIVSVVGSATSITLDRSLTTVTAGATFCIAKACWQHEGAFQVTGISSNIITVKNTSYSPYAPPKLGLGSCTMAALTSVLTVASGGTTGLILSGTIDIDNIALVGFGSTGTGLDLRGGEGKGSTQVYAGPNFACLGFGTGAYISGGSFLSAQNSFINGASLTAVNMTQGGFATLDNAYIQGNGNYSVVIDGGYVRLSRCRFGCNGIDAIYTGPGGSFYADWPVANSNAGNGLELIGATSFHFVGGQCLLNVGDGALLSTGPVGRCTGSMFVCNTNAGINSNLANYEGDYCLLAGNTYGATPNNTRFSHQTAGIVDNTNRGVYATGASNGQAVGSFITANPNGGIVAADSEIDATNIYCVGNGGNDILPISGAEVYVQGYVGSPNFGIPLNQPGLSGSLITNDNYLSPVYNAITLNEAGNIAVGTATGTKIGTATNQKLGVYGATPIVQRSGSAQAAVATTSSTNSSPYGYTTAAQADAIVTLVNELRAWAVSQGFIKGSA